MKTEGKYRIDYQGGDRKFQGYIFRQPDFEKGERVGRVILSCKHEHPTKEEALACAEMLLGKIGKLKKAQ